MNTTTTPLPEVPLPAGAISAGPWEAGEPEPFRYVKGIRQTAMRGLLVDTEHTVTICTEGAQYTDGRIGAAPCIAIAADDTDTDIRLDIAQARDFIRALTEAVEEIDRWTHK